MPTDYKILEYGPDGRLVRYQKDDSEPVMVRRGNTWVPQEFADRANQFNSPLKKTRKKRKTVTPELRALILKALERDKPAAVAKNFDLSYATVYKIKVDAGL